MKDFDGIEIWGKFNSFADAVPSCISILAVNSLAILAFSDNVFLITRATDANLPILAICIRLSYIESRCIQTDCAEVVIVWVRMND